MFISVLCLDELSPPYFAKSLLFCQVTFILLLETVINSAFTLDRICHWVAGWIGVIKVLKVIAV